MRAIKFMEQESKKVRNVKCIDESVLRTSKRARIYAYLQQFILGLENKILLPTTLLAGLAMGTSRAIRFGHSS